MGIEETGHVELIGTTIGRLLDGSPRYQGNPPTDPLGQGRPGRCDTPGPGAEHRQHSSLPCLGAQGAKPVDAAGNAWSGNYVYNSGSLVLDLLYNLMLESTGRLQNAGSMR